MKLLSCLACEDTDCSRPKAKCKNAFACFELDMFYSNGDSEVKKGCLESPRLAKLQCNLNQNRSTANPRIAYRCCFENYCNNGTNSPSLPAQNSSDLSQNILLITTISALLAGLVFIILAYYFLTKFKKERSSNSYIDDSESETSGSGLGMPLFTSRNFARDVHLIEKFYKGRSTEVWKGKYLGHAVAVKVYYSRDEHLFLRELDVYRSLNKHSNILEIFTSDCTSTDSCTQQWLVTTYYEFGSLFDYLNTYPIGQAQCVSMLLGLINGLDYLHSEDNVPEIAHRDLKSKNILVMDHWNVCLADFGLAVSYFRDPNKLIGAEKIKVGTVRYMAPEILADTFDESIFESFKKADIYSLALVIWEVVRRCVGQDGTVDEYNLPFEGIVSRDPSFADMLKVVYYDKQRPPINDRMLRDPVLLRLSNIIEECWNEVPSKRYTSLRLKKSLIKINTDFWQ